MLLNELLTYGFFMILAFVIVMCSEQQLLLCIVINHFHPAADSIFTNQECMVTLSCYLLIDHM